MRPGEVYYADVPLAGWRPIIVVSREDLNRGRTVLAIPTTTVRFVVRSRLPNCVPFRAGEFGFTSDCVAQGEQTGPVPVAGIDVANGPLGVLDDIALRTVIRAIGYVIEADCEPI
jgi:mRNA-degrading endonuclease toxin of MazEF toxin-antitoxin module